MNLVQDPPSLDPATAFDNISSSVLWGAYEGLTKYAKDGSIVPGIAKSWDISDNQLTYTFHLRDAKWSNGDPVTAGDFEYAWKHALSPKTASKYAYILYYLKNAQAFNIGEITDSAMIMNGPFTISVWKHDDSLVLKKNPNYYNANKTKLDEVM